MSDPDDASDRSTAAILRDAWRQQWTEAEYACGCQAKGPAALLYPECEIHGSRMIRANKTPQRQA